MITKDDLDLLYNKNKLTIYEIANKYDVSKQRISQLLIKYNIRNNIHKNNTQFRNGKIYPKKVYNIFELSQTGERWQREIINTLGKTCMVCNIQEHKVHIHHVVYPAKSYNDLLVLCPSCHGIIHKGGITKKTKCNIINDYYKTKDETLVSLSLKYKLTFITTFHILRAGLSKNASKISLYEKLPFSELCKIYNQDMSLLLSKVTCAENAIMTRKEFRRLLHYLYK